ncbi:MAG: glycosyltransferase family 4 protein [Thermotogae bacterium]|nr:glycosyltransferase family 4 protein [Thermotogota bacterium]
MKLLILSDAPRVAGSEIWLAENLPRLANLGVNITLAIPKSSNLEPLIRRLNPSSNIQVLRYVTFRDVDHVAKKADLRLLQAWFPGTYRVLKDWSSPKWVISHDQILYHYPAPIRQLYDYTYLFTKARQMKLADGVITCSHWASNYLKEHYGINSIGIPNGVDLIKYQPALEEEKRLYKEKLGLGQKFVWLMPARYTLEKNHLTAIRLAKRLKQATFVFAGDGSLRHFYKHLTRAWGLKNIIFKPFIEDITAFYKAADAILFPTLAENQSLTTLEAMAMGLPIITSDIPAQRELINNGEEGFALPLKISVLENAANKIMNDPNLAKKLGERARQKVVANHDINHTATELYKTLKKIVES